MPIRKTLLLLAACLLTGLTRPGEAQTPTSFRGCSHVVVPQARSYTLRPSIHPAGVEVESVAARVKIVERTARTALEVRLVNRGGRQAEAVVLIPVPAGAVVSSFEFEGSAHEPTARLLPRDEARRTYDEIVARIKDPALLEFAGYQLIRTSVFPVAAGGTQRVRLAYEHVLPSDGDRVDYVLPRSESLEHRTPWSIEVSVQDKRPISTVYSPSHRLISERLDARRFRLSLDPHGASDPGPFLLSFLRARSGVTASLFAYPDLEIGGGYFLLMAGLPEGSKNRPGKKREVTFVLDRSGSMAGPKMEQARAACLQIIEGLEPGESFNIIDYATTVHRFAPHPVVKTESTLERARQYIGSIRPTGGTNVYDALHEALRPEPREGALPLVLFLTDGLPTVGRTLESEIHELIRKGNAHDRRVFTFGVGGDVNVPLLDRISDRTRAVATYVLPEENVELKVAGVFRRLKGPVLSDVRIETVDGTGSVTTVRVGELIPDPLPDLFDGDQMILLGQYRGNDPLEFRLSGDLLGSPRTFGFKFDLDAATTRNAFVPRLWAGRRIAYLVDQIRQLGAGTSPTPVVVGATPPEDPRFRELVDEIVRLSTEFGILSEYTSFLATEGTRLDDWSRIVDSCSAVLNERALNCRSGVKALNQGLNFNSQKLQSQRNYQNSFWDENLSRVEIAGVQQVCDRTFFRRGSQWIDARLISAKQELASDSVIHFGSAEHRALLDELIRENRQGVLSLRGEILLRYQGKTILIKE